jgi:hypothetical protein
MYQVSISSDGYSLLAASGKFPMFAAPKFTKSGRRIVWESDEQPSPILFAKMLGLDAVHIEVDFVDTDAEHVESMA